MALNPFSPTATFKGRIGRKGKKLLSSNPIATFYAANGRVAAYFVGKGRLAGPNGNRYRVTLNRLNSTPRWLIRVWDPAGTLLGSSVAVASLSAMVANVAAEADLKDIVDLVVVQDVNEALSSTANFPEATPFSGGN
jgi:hypothetical protein